MFVFRLASRQFCLMLLLLLLPTFNWLPINSNSFSFETFSLALFSILKFARRKWWSLLWTGNHCLLRFCLYFAGRRQQQKKCDAIWSMAKRSSCVCVVLCFFFVVWLMSKHIHILFRGTHLFSALWCGSHDLWKIKMPKSKHRNMINYILGSLWWFLFSFSHFYLLI